MRDRRTTFVVIVALTTVVVLFLYAVLQAILLRGFAAVEYDATAQNVERAIDGLSEEYNFLDKKSADWANWDDTYAFMTNENPVYVESNLTDQAFVDLNVSLILYLHPDGHLLRGKAYDLEKKVATPVSTALLSHLSPSGMLLGASAVDDKRGGLLLLPEGALWIIARPVLTSDGLGPSRGTLVMGRYVDRHLVGQVSQTTHLDIAFYRWDEPTLAPELAQVRDSISRRAPVTIRPLDEQTVAGSAAMYDIYDQPALLINITTPRPIHQQGQTTLGYVIGAIIIVAIITSAISQVMSARMQRAIRESEERYSLAAQGANDGLWDWDLGQGKVYYSPRFRSMLGLPDQEVGSSPQEWLDRIHPDDLVRVQAEISDHLEGKSQFLESEHRVMDRGGEYLWVLCRGLAVRGKNGRAYRMAGSLSDISGRKRAEAQLVHDALRDALTGLPNRVLFNDRLDRAIERGKRDGNKTYAVLYLDLDRFKGANDNYGHGAGDQLLVDCTHRLQRCVRSMDTVARLGGDEFVILLDDIADLADATGAAERVLAEMRLPFDIGGHTIYVSTSIGIVMGTAGTVGIAGGALGAVGYDRAEPVLRDADIAMYSAKSNGRDRFEVFDHSMRQRTLQRLEIELELRGAVERGEFEVYYQPLVRLGDRCVIGFEALVRWHHPTRGLLEPDAFIAVAEETGLIVPVGDWVLQTACAQVKRWLEDGVAPPSLSISVNLSARQFLRPGLTQRIQEVLAQTGLPAHQLHLEITETTIMDCAEQNAAIIRQLRELGVAVEIDDFGTGFSSLSYLQQFAINTLKIDRAFISGMGAGPRGKGTETDIVRAIVTLARQLGLTVVAEGIETTDQLALLQSLDCQLGQGFLFSAPVTPEQAAGLLSRQSTVDTRLSTAG